MPHPNLSDDNLAISPAGWQRHNEMRTALCEQVRRTHGRRMRRKYIRAASVYLLLIAASVLAVVIPIYDGQQHGSSVANRSATSVHDFTGQSRQIITAVFETDRNASERFSIQGSQHAEMISDQELLQTLEEIGQPAGLIRSGGTTRLVLDSTG